MWKQKEKYARFKLCFLTSKCVPTSKTIHARFKIALFHYLVSTMFQRWTLVVGLHSKVLEITSAALLSFQPTIVSDLSLVAS